MLGELARTSPQGHSYREDIPGDLRIHSSQQLYSQTQIVMAARPGILLFEAANPRHNHEVDVFQQLRHLIPEDKVLVPGVIDSTSNCIEHPRLVAKRLLEFCRIVGKERQADLGVLERKLEISI